MSGRGRSRARSAPGADIAARLLAWYDAERRDLPWRYAPGIAADPYRVWLSEIMLQQTTVAAVIPYFAAFTRRWPTVGDLAAAPLDDVLAAWAGLGYYARARNMHACARAVASDHCGRFPADEATLRALPGIGPYTAAAVAAIGHGLKATPIDGNVERVVTRLYAIAEPLPASKPTVRAHAEALTPELRAGDFAQAMMDLGATVCTPREPRCDACPLASSCRARAEGIAATLPARLAKAARPDRHGVAFVVATADDHVLLRRRPPRGLLGGMLEVPSTPWQDAAPDAAAVRAAAPLPLAFAPVAGSVVHVFTHFRLELAVHVARAPGPARSLALPDGATWLPRRDLAAAAVPSLFSKVLAHADQHFGPDRLIRPARAARRS